MELVFKLRTRETPSEKCIDQKFNLILFLHFRCPQFPTKKSTTVDIKNPNIVIKAMRFGQFRARVVNDLVDLTRLRK